MALRVALVLPMAMALRLNEEGFPNVALKRECIHAPENLANSLAFNPTWWKDQAQGPVHTERESCDLFQGPGRNCDIEAPEHYLSRKWIPETATVIEFGARFGTTTCELAKRLGNSGNLVAVEPDPRVWETLDQNLKSNNCHAHVIRGAISKVPLHIKGGSYSTQTACVSGEEVANYYLTDVEKVLGRSFDTMLIDCEGCGTQMMDQIVPALKTTVKTVVLEKDGGADYTSFLKVLADLGFEEAEKVNDCDKATTGQRQETWCGEGLWHYVFIKKAA